MSDKKKIVKELTERQKDDYEELIEQAIESGYKLGFADWKDFKDAINEVIKAERERIVNCLDGYLKPAYRRSYWVGVEIDYWVLSDDDYKDLKQKYGVKDET